MLIPVLWRRCLLRCGCRRRRLGQVAVFTRLRLRIRLVSKAIGAVVRIGRRLLATVIRRVVRRWLLRRRTVLLARERGESAWLSSKRRTRLSSGSGIGRRARCGPWIVCVFLAAPGSGGAVAGRERPARVEGHRGLPCCELSRFGPCLETRPDDRDDRRKEESGRGGGGVVVTLFHHSNARRSQSAPWVRSVSQSS